MGQTRMLQSFIIMEYYGIRTQGGIYFAGILFSYDLTFIEVR
jgi:hypothetical protein